MISKGAFALMLFPDGIFFVSCFPKMQPSHRLSGFSINGKPLTIPFLCNKFNPPKLRFPEADLHMSIFHLENPHKTFFRPPTFQSAHVKVKPHYHYPI